MLAQQTLPGLPAPRFDADAVIARSAIRRIGWLRSELERDDVAATPSLLDVYERELAELSGSVRLRLQVAK